MTTRLSSHDPTRSQRELSREHLDYDDDGDPILTVAVTGARAGQTLVGADRKSKSWNGSSRGVALEVVSGLVTPIQSIAGRLSEEQLVNAYVKAYGISRAQAVIQVRGRVPAAQTDNARPMGSSCPNFAGDHHVMGNCDCPSAKFRILQPGAQWTEYAEEQGHYEELMRFVRDGTEVTWRQILRLFGIHFLALRSRLFAVSSGPMPVPVDTPGAIPCCFGMPDDGSQIAFQLPEGLVVAACGSAEAAEEDTMANAVALVEEALEQTNRTRLERIYERISPLTMGGLKSVQKIVRLAPVGVRLGEGGMVVPASEYACMAFARILLSKGSFVPELQTYTRGCVAGFKRVAVTLVEDAWAGTPADLTSLLGTALICHLVPSYHPPRSSLVHCLRLAGEALTPRNGKLGVIDWRIGSGNDRERVWLDCSKADTQFFGWSAQLLRVLRSFDGDMDMMDAVANVAQRSGRVPLRFCHQESRLSVIPDAHIVDQHAFRGIAHVLRLPATDKCTDEVHPAVDSFAHRFNQLIFRDVTGQNPRLHDLSGFEERQGVKAVRFAQEMVLRFALARHYPPAPLETIGEEEIRQPIHPGVLAGGVGPVTEKGHGTRELYVILGTQEPNEEMVILKPNRRVARDLLYWGTSQDPAERAKVALEKEQAIQRVRSRRLTVHSPLLPANRVAEFRDGHWHFDGIKWSDLVVLGRQHRVILHRPPSWAESLGGFCGDDLLKKNEAIREALSVTGEGLVADAKNLILHLAKTTDSAVVARAQQLLLHQYEKVWMPTPSRLGGLGTDQLQAYEGDWDVYRFLVLLSRLAPGALRPQMPPRFKVVNPVLLVIVSEWLTARVSVSVARVDDSPWRQFTEWREVESRLPEVLRQHQKDAVAHMQERASQGHRAHYLVMDTGTGKTFTALEFAVWRLMRTELGKTIRRIIWVTPSGQAIKTSRPDGLKRYTLIDEQLKELAGDGYLKKLGIQLPTEAKPMRPVPIVFVQPRHQDFEDYKINLIGQDALRLMMDRLTSLASTSLFIFDEVDECYNPSLRTSNALRLAALCPEMVAMTATPIPNKANMDRFGDWLAMTVQYPFVDQWVPATGMVMIRIALGIKRAHHLVEVDPTDPARRAYDRYRERGDWFALANTIIAETTDSMCREAARLADQDLAQRPDGGCLVVCDDGAHVMASIERMRQLRPDLHCGPLAELDAKPRRACIFVAKTVNRGYNASRLGAMVRQPYSGNVSDRLQMEGRIARLTQTRERIDYSVVVMKNTMMALLHDRQQANDAVNVTLEQLAKEYSPSVFQGD